MVEIVYMLCGLTSLACTVFLWRGYLRTNLALLFWSGAAFLAFTVANILLFLDLVAFPHMNLLIWRQVINLAGVVLLLYGLIQSNE